jgi:hypothetical protein
MAKATRKTETNQIATPQQTALFQSIRTAFSLGDTLAVDVAAQRVAALCDILENNKAEAIETIISNEWLDANMVAKSKARADQYASDMIAAASEAEKSAEDWPTKVAAINKTRAALYSEYIRWSERRTAIRAFYQYPDAWRAFKASALPWNDRISDLRDAIKAADDAATIERNAAVLLIASEKTGPDGKVAPTIDAAEAKVQAVNMAEAAKEMRKRAKAETDTVAADCLALIAKRGASAEAVLAKAVCVALPNRGIYHDDVIEEMRARCQTLADQLREAVGLRELAEAQLANQKQKRA